MSTKLISGVQEFQCCVCWTLERAQWGVLATGGWRSHYAGEGVVPVILCGGCSDHIADRRDAHRRALEEELREVK